MDDPFSLDDLQRVLRDSRGAAPGPAQWAAEVVSPKDSLLTRFPAARSSHLDLLSIRFDLQGSAPPALAPKARSRRKEFESRFDGLAKIAKGLYLAEHRLHGRSFSRDTFAQLHWGCPSAG